MQPRWGELQACLYWPSIWEVWVSLSMKRELQLDIAILLVFVSMVKLVLSASNPLGSANCNRLFLSFWNCKFATQELCSISSVMWPGLWCADIRGAPFSAQCMPLLTQLVTGPKRHGLQFAKSCLKFVIFSPFLELESMLDGHLRSFPLIPHRGGLGYAPESWRYRRSRRLAKFQGVGVIGLKPQSKLVALTLASKVFSGWLHLSRWFPEFGPSIFFHGSLAWITIWCKQTTTLRMSFPTMCAMLFLVFSWLTTSAI